MKKILLLFVLTAIVLPSYGKRTSKTPFMETVRSPIVSVREDTTSITVFVKVPEALFKKI